MALAFPPSTSSADPNSKSVTGSAPKIRVLLIGADSSEFLFIQNLLDDVAPSNFALSYESAFDDALNALNANNHDVAIINSFIGERRATDFLKAVQLRGNQIPFIMLSSEIDLNLDREALDAGAADYLVKEQLSAILLERSIRYALERRRSREQLQRLLEFERLISEVSTSFINLPPEQIDSGISLALQAIGKFVHVDRASLFEFSNDRQSLRMSYEWCGQDIERAAHRYQQLPAKVFGSIIEQLAQDIPWYFQDLAEVSPDLADFKLLLQDRGVSSLIIVPMISGGNLYGFVSFATFAPDRKISSDLISTFKIAGQIFAGVIERRETVKELNEKKYFLRQVIDANPNVIFARDRNSKYTLVNKAAADTLGDSVENILGRTIDEVVGDNALAQRAKLEDDEVFKTGQAVYDPEFVALHRKSGQRKWYQSIKTPLFLGDNQPAQILGVFSDITERKRAEDSLRAILKGTATSTADNFFRSLVQHLAGTLGMRYAFVARVSDLKRSMLQTLAFWSDNNFADNFEYCFLGGPCEQVLDKHLTCITDSLRNKFPDCSAVSQLNAQNYLGVPIIDSDGEALGVLAVMNDLPVSDWSTASTLLTIFAARAGAEIERIDAEQESIRLQRQLTQSQKMDAIGQLAAGVAHDLNNALGAVIGHLELMKISEGINTDVRSSVEIALNGCERATSLIEQLLGFTRQGKFNFSSIGLRKICGETIDFLRKIIGPDLKIQILEPKNTGGTPYDSELLVYGDPAQIQQALTNLTINAKHAMPGGGSLVFGFGTKFVKSPQHFNPHARPGQYCSISVTDSGSGIDPVIIDKIFEPFFTTKAERKGSGLGLAMVYGIMQRHGGWIEVQSELGKGSTFSLLFPKLHGSAIQQAVKPMESSKMAGGNILVIDDEVFLVDLAKKFLELNGFGVNGFCDAAEAVKWFASHYAEVDLVIMDMKMPSMDGKSCFEQLRALDPSARVVVLSGYLQDDSVHSLLQHGAVKFFQKPLKYPELVQWISQYLANNIAPAQH